jgi:hypothetical protein
VKAKKILSQHKVRTSTRDRTLDEMLPSFPSRSQSGTPRTPAAGGGRDAPIEVDNAPTPMSAAKDRPIEEAACSLVSVEGLREEVTKSRHHGRGASSEAHTRSTDSCGRPDEDHPGGRVRGHRRLAPVSVPDPAS